MTSYVLGIDFGSTTAKVVVLDEHGEIIASSISAKGSVSDEGVRFALAEALERANVELSEIARVVSTGYGRRMLDIADRTITEITCHARGALALVPEAQVVIDIGGQDSKVIAIDKKGNVGRFAMNDRCAAGTGKFLEVLARAVNVDLDAMGAEALSAPESVQITSMCATFAETEVISLLAEGVPRATVLAGVHQSIGNRTVGLVGRVGQKDPIVMTGGVAQNIAAVHYLEKALNTTLIIPVNAQLAGALGAALFALDDVRAGKRHLPDDADAGKLETLLLAPTQQGPYCRDKSAQNQIPVASKN